MKTLIKLFLIPLVLSFVPSQEGTSLKLGQAFPDFSFQGQFQKQNRLKDYKGSYVLIHFWASWNQESRDLQQVFIPVYSRYKDRRFNVGRKFYVISVSLDEEEKLYQLALKKDNLPWGFFYCDYKGWNSPLCKMASIQAIPTNYLIDPNGDILAKNITAQELEAILREK